MALFDEYRNTLNSIVGGAEKRRLSRFDELNTQVENAPVQSDTATLSPTSNASDIERSFAQGVNDIRGSGYALRGLVRQALGDKSEANKDFAAFQDIEQASERGGPKRLRRLSDVEGVGDAAGYAANLVARQIPSLALTVGTGVAGGGVGRAVATRLATNVARSELIGGAAGAAASSLPLNASDNVDAALDTSTGDSAETRAQKALVGTLAASSLDVLPVVRQLKQLGIGRAANEVVSETAERFLPKVAKEAGKQALAEGSTEAAQTAVSLATHKWVNDNVSLTDDEALQQYLESGVAGGLLGGLFGGAGQVATSVGGTPLQLPDVKAKVKEAVGKFDEKFGQPKQSTKPGQPVNPDGSPIEPGVDVTEGADEEIELRSDPGDIFNEEMSNLKADDDLTNTSNQIMTPAELRAGRRSDSNPQEFGSPLKNTVATFVPTESAFWALEPETTNRIMDGVEQVFRGGGENPKEAGKLFNDFLEFIPERQRQTMKLKALEWGERERRLGEVTKDEETASTPDPDQIDPKVINRIGFVRGDRPDFTARAAQLGTGGVQATDAEGRTGLLNLSALTSQRMQRTGKETEGGMRRVIRSFQDALGDAILAGYKFSPEQFNEDTVIFQPRSGEPVRLGRRGALAAKQAVFNPTGNPVEFANVNQIPEGVQPAYNELPRDQRTDITEEQPIAPERVAADVKEWRAELQDPKTTPERRIELQQQIDTRRKATSVEATDDTRIEQSNEDQSVLAPRNAPPASMSPVQAVEIDDAALDSTGRLQRDPRGFVERARLRALGRLGESILSGSRRDVVSIRQLGQALSQQEDRQLLANLRDASRGQTTSIDEQLRTDGRRALAAAYGAVAQNTTEAATMLMKATPSQLLKAGIRFRTAELMQKAQQSPQLATRIDDALKTPDEKHATELRRVGFSEFAKAQKRLVETGQLSQELYERRVAEAKKDADFQLREGQRVQQRPTDTSGARVVFTKDDTNTIDTKESSREQRQYKEKFDQDIAVGFDELPKKQGHNLVKEEAMLNALLNKLGIKERLKVRDAGKRKSAGAYSGKLGTVYIRDNITGQERADVLFHETGHHIFKTEYDALPQSTKDAINADFEKWLEQNSDSSVRVAEVLASRKAPGRAQAILERSGDQTVDELIRLAATGDKEATKTLAYLFEFEEYVADQLARALGSSAEAQGVVAQFFKKLADMLRSLYNEVFSNPAYAQYKPAESVEQWVESMFDRTRNTVSAVENEAVSQQQADATLDAAIRWYTNPNDMSALRTYMSTYLAKEDRLTLERAFEKHSIEQKIRAGLTPDELKLLDNQASRLENLLAFGYRAWARGEIKIGPEALQSAQGVSQRFQNIAGILSNTQQALNILTAVRNQKYKPGQSSPPVARNAAQKVFNTAYNFVGNKLRPWSDAFLKNYLTRMEETGVPAFRELAAEFELRTGQKANRPGYNQSVWTDIGQWMNKYNDVVADLSDKQKRFVLRRLQRRSTSISNDAAVNKAVDEFRNKVMPGLHEYLDKRGVTSPGEQTKLRNIENFFPVVTDAEKVGSDEKGFKALLDQPKFHDAIYDTFIKLAEDDLRAAKARGNNATAVEKQRRIAELQNRQVPIDTLIDQLYKSAARPEEVGPNTNSAVGAMPGFESRRRRTMQFIYDHGTEDDIKKFVSYQIDDLDAAVGRYVIRAVKRGEYTSRFGQDGARLQKILARAKVEGATDDQLQLARDFVDANTGIYGNLMSPTLKGVFDGVDKVFGTKLGQLEDKSGKARKLIQAVMVYQNLRTLPLATLSSLSDPLGLFVRAGGDLNTAWTGLKEGIKSAAGKSNGETERLARMLGIVEDGTINDALAFMYGGAPGTKLQKVNDALFKWNGLAGFTRNTRIMALAAGQTFLLKHAQNSDPKSTEYLSELNVRPQDIKEASPGRVKVLTETERETATPDELASDDRVRAALATFVDQSILRPTAAQRPGWHSDPYFALVAQYKSFIYSFHERIVRRAMQEAGRGNYSALLPLFAYVPAALGTELIRELIQYGEDGNPQRKNWTADDYLWMATQRSGLLGPGTQMGLSVKSDETYNNILGTSLLGPTGQQARDVLSTLSGGKPVASTALQALPGSVAYQHWLQ